MLCFKGVSMKCLIGGRKGVPELLSTRERLHAHTGRLERIEAKEGLEG